MTPLTKFLKLLSLVLLTNMLVSNKCYSQAALKSLLLKKRYDNAAKMQLYDYYITKEDVSPKANASTDLTVPDIAGGNFNVIPTPSFYYSQNYGSKIVVVATAFGTATGIDSSLQRLGAKLLIPEASLFGIKIQGASTIGSPTYNSENKIASVASLVYEINFMAKKISYFDTGTKVSTNMSPFFIQPKIGLVGTFFNNHLNAGFYYNLLTVQTKNEEFEAFFKTKKKAFFYPEIDINATIDVDNSGTRYLKFGLQSMINAKGLRTISNSTDNLVVFFKVGFATAL